ncbi:MAG TPA: helix-turn-helix domain-containing protein [Candidatus Dormibacteraeota bacterium]|nr:helix-turn-helix domain-containing protein [Candidatus Dormibacteraeota bacterium]
MKAATRTPSPAHRMSAEDRREQVLKAAMAEFAIHGLDGTSTEAIAERAGISQPYIFRLWPNKKDLFLATVDACFDRFEAVLKNTAEGRADADIGAQLKSVGHDPSGHPHLTGPGARLHAMGHAYMRLLAKPEAPLMQMQAYAACWDDDVRRLVRNRWNRLRTLVSELSGVEGRELSEFFARGMLLNVAACMHLPATGDPARWAHEVLGFA